MADKLANAPLTEVVFEMHWAVAQDPSSPLVFDPGYAPALDALTRYAKESGLGTIRDYQTEYAGLGFSISRRFYPDDGAPFPLLQLGFGIFAANESPPNYEWDAFKESTLEAAMVVFSNYGKLERHPFRLTSLELRYLNSFGDEAGGGEGVTAFVNSATTIHLAFPTDQFPKTVRPSHRGRLGFEADLAKPTDGRFVIDIVSAKKEEKPYVRLETKVLSRGENLLKSKNPKQMSARLADWLEDAHNVTSPAFRAVVKPEILETFK